MDRVGNPTSEVKQVLLLNNNSGGTRWGNRYTTLPDFSVAALGRAVQLENSELRGPFKPFPSESLLRRAASRYITATQRKHRSLACNCEASLETQRKGHRSSEHAASIRQRGRWVRLSGWRSTERRRDCLRLLAADWERRVTMVRHGLDCL